LERRVGRVRRAWEKRKRGGKRVGQKGKKRGA